jgi:hypothetical protein
VKLVFIINRLDTYRFFSTLINEGINREFEIEIWHNYLNKYKLPCIELSPFFNLNNNKVRFLKLSKKKNLVDSIKLSKGVDFFVSLNPVDFEIDKYLHEKIDSKWCIIQHGHDSFSTVWGWQAFNFDGSLLQNYNRLFFSYSEFFFKDKVEWIKRNSKSYGYDTSNYTFFTSKYTKVFSIGATILDQHILNLEKNNIYLKYNIPSEKKVFIYLPFVFYPPRSTYDEKGTYSWQVVFTSAQRDFRLLKNYLKSFQIKRLSFFIIKKIIFWFKIFSDKEARLWLINGWNEEAVLRSAKHFCDENNMVLIIKPKPKTLEPYKGSKYAFLTVEDEGHQNYPSILHELISISTIVLGFHTSAVTESVISKNHHINLECPGSNLANNKARLENHHTEEGGKNNFPGVVTNMKIPEFIAKFPSLNINDLKVNSLAREKYMEKHTGQSCVSAPKRFYEILENN